MRESDFRSLVVSMLRPVNAFAMECLTHDGVPDVCTVAGWIELKLATSPKRASTRVDVDLRKSQRIWLRRWRLHGGHAWTLTLLDDYHWLLHDGLWAAEHLGRADVSVLRQMNLLRTARPSGLELVAALMDSRRTMRRSNDADKETEEQTETRVEESS